MTTKKDISIFWFRQDLRLSDNPGLTKSLESKNVLPVYILDDINSGENKMGGASRWWLHRSLENLNKQLDNKISFYSGDPLEIFKNLIAKFNLKGIYWNRCYEPWRIKRDTNIKKYLIDHGIEAYSYNSNLLWEPNQILKVDQTPYKVFTPYYKKGCLNHDSPRIPIAKPNLEKIIEDEENKNDLENLNLLDKKKWYSEFENLWQPGENHAHNKFSIFLENGLNGYKYGRNFPSKENVSQLSPHLHFGEISPNQIWYKLEEKSDDYSEKDLYHFKSELGWREFSYYLNFHFPELNKNNLQSKFDNFPWGNDPEFLNSWKKGLTGYPIVDAGMRELWKTGYMHNRVRMIVGSFLVKNLLIHWKEGERWFWDCLIDADLASNSASWQWVAGTGADAAPYFRIFNPVLQGSKFDPEGKYTKKYLPELNKLPIKYLFDPWNAPEDELIKANVNLGSNYPKPIIDLKDSRHKALESFSGL